MATEGWTLRWQRRSSRRIRGLRLFRRSRRKAEEMKERAIRGTDPLSSAGGAAMQVEQTMDTTKKARRERGTGRVWQIGEVWYIQYYVNGRQVRKSSGSTSETFAKKLLQKRLGEAA